MQLSETRFVKIEGTNVTAAVNSAAEAKYAIAEVRQKKREFTHIRRGLQRERKTAEREVMQAERRKKGKPPSLLGKVRSAISMMANMTGASASASAMQDLPRIEIDCAKTDEILHNLDAVLIQLQGKVLRLS